MYPKLVALALGVALTIGVAAGEARAATECAVTIPIVGIRVDVCANTDRASDRRAERDRGTCNCDERSGTCNLEAHNSQGNVEPEGKNENVSTAVCTRP